MTTVKILSRMILMAIISASKDATLSHILSYYKCLFIYLTKLSWMDCHSGYLQSLLQSKTYHLPRKFLTQTSFLLSRRVNIRAYTNIHQMIQRSVELKWCTATTVDHCMHRCKAAKGALHGTCGTVYTWYCSYFKFSYESCCLLTWDD